LILPPYACLAYNSTIPYGRIPVVSDRSYENKHMASDKVSNIGGGKASQSEALYRLLFENCMDGIMKTSPNGSIFDANPAACAIFERTREEIIAAGREGLIDGSDPRLPGLIEQRKLTGKAHGELNGRRRDGSLFPVEFSSVVFENLQGEPRTCIIIRDISERKAADDERERLIQELQDAMARVKSLSGLLPICASCKKIRDEQGQWHHLELYIRSHSKAEFSHGICPECQLELYPEHTPKKPLR
jgi:PAS domain S-box-containing protein